ncbi:hypothetical protein GE21DRAFT_8498 [Neurospora crassa]|uniref:Uncharacterized protein n=1 Tax=Neurospora crassa (strain ATCC 24698 / 74-OR23-1A / CBS 708.71 / DSM 1257 / FGSC 987) TaxID=367110 RepID=Q7RZ15_NEUCR|nr:hypothetical protein NCU07184 [Neurospora crassa OR74A]EAA28173.3 hypothetical protein NCU07184 [Neurospora crassa OR74A]KHE85785.1 hypothetical protein GE21DRAFT_8498 [Neurospora crassa]|eukprot:XP_957409.3 hypothetical protein NCU07184 [Neurospora crassa OR74A]
MSSSSADLQPEVMNSSQPSNASSSVPDVPITSGAATPTPSTPSLSIKILNALNLSSIPATLKLSGSLINGHPLSDHGDNDYVMIYSGNAAECPRSFIIHLDLTGDNAGDVINRQEEGEEEQIEEKGQEDRLDRQQHHHQQQQQQQQQQQPIPYNVESRDGHDQRHLQTLDEVSCRAKENNANAFVIQIQENNHFPINVPPSQAFS